MWNVENDVHGGLLCDSIMQRICLQLWETGPIPGSGRLPGRREWQLTPLLPAEPMADGARVTVHGDA